MTRTTETTDTKTSAEDRLAALEARIAICESELSELPAIVDYRRRLANFQHEQRLRDVAALPVNERNEALAALSQPHRRQLMSMTSAAAAIEICVQAPPGLQEMLVDDIVNNYRLQKTAQAACLGQIPKQVRIATSSPEVSWQANIAGKSFAWKPGQMHAMLEKDFELLKAQSIALTNAVASGVLVVTPVGDEGDCLAYMHGLK